MFCFITPKPSKDPWYLQLALISFSPSPPLKRHALQCPEIFFPRSPPLRPSCFRSFPLSTLFVAHSSASSIGFAYTFLPVHFAKPISPTDSMRHHLPTVVFGGPVFSLSPPIAWIPLTLLNPLEKPCVLSFPIRGCL